jgi:hypothetical protein
MLKVLIVVENGLLGVAPIKNVQKGIIKSYSSNSRHVFILLQKSARPYFILT